MSHVPATDLHVYASRQIVVETRALSDHSSTDLNGVTYKLSDGTTKACTLTDTSDGLVVSATLTGSDTTSLGAGRFRWWMLPEDDNANLLDPLAEGLLRVSEAP